MRKINCIYFLFIVLLLSACSSKDDMLEYVPADANVVAKINSESLIEKSGFNVDGKVGDVTPEDMANLLSAVELPSDMMEKSGIDFEKDIAVFGMSKYFSFGVLIPLDDSDKFKAIIQKNDKSLASKNGVKYRVNSNMVYAYKDNVGLICKPASRLNADVALKNIVALFNQEGKTIKDNKDAMKGLDKDNDVVCYFNYENFWKSNEISRFPELMGNPVVAIMQSALKGIYKYQICTMDFEKDKVKLEATSYPNKDSEAYKACKSIFTPIKDTKFLKLFPSDANFMMAFSAKGDKIAQSAQFVALLQQVSILPGNISGQIKDAVNSIDGPIAIGVRGDKVDENVLMSIAIKSSQPQQFIQLIQSIAPMVLGRLEKEGEAYILKRPNFYMRFGVNDGYFYATTSRNVISNEAYSDKKLRDVFDDSVFSMFGTSGVVNSYLATSLRESCGFDLTGNFWSKASSFEKNESQLEITKPVGKNILPVLMKILSGIQNTSLKNSSAVDTQSDDPYSYTPGQPLDDLYNH